MNSGVLQLDGSEKFYFTVARSGEMGLKAMLDYESLKELGQTYYDLPIEVRVSAMLKPDRDWLDKGLAKQLIR